MAKALSLVLIATLSSVLSSRAVQLGEKLSAGNPPWISRGNTFAFGFYSTTSGMSTLAIWYQSTGTVVWEATLDNGASTKERVSVSRNGVLELTATGLVVTDASKPVWTSNLRCNNRCSVTVASLEENGNLVLLGNGTRLWQSFDSPTDTILPEQDLVGNMTLVSGKYRLSMNKSSVGLYFDGFSANESYWSVLNKDLDVTMKNSIPRLTFNRNGSLEFFDANGSSWYRYKYDNAQRYPIDYGNSSVLRRLTLEKNGTLRSYSTYGERSLWRVVWQSLLLECDVFGTCGNFGLCKYQPRKSCVCPPGFHTVRDRSSGQLDGDFPGCSYNFPLNCSNSKMVELARADFLGSGYIVGLNSSMSLEQCKKLCLDDCQCVGAAYTLDGSGQCRLRKGGSTPYNIVQSPQKASIALIKLSASDTRAQADPNDMKNLFVTSMNASDLYQADSRKSSGTKFFTASRALVFGVAVGEFVILCCVVIATSMWWRRSNKKMWNKHAGDHHGPTRFSYEQLEIATGNFRHKLGSGGFGSVYKGVLPDKTVVAVKTLEVATHGENQFKAEVATLGTIHHVNLVKLLGYCVEGSHRVLVYEYMTNGSLDKVLTSIRAPWKTRYSIAMGIARGITYLHEECYECILHCDIKPQNILLDQNLCPKVADFGLAKLTKKEMALNVTTIRGTRGYLAPEWISNRPITTKVDVYSYGMVLLELLSGHDKSRSGQNTYFSVWAFQKYMAGEFESIVDPKPVTSVEWSQFERMLKTAFWCIQLDANLRPSMSRVIQMLEDNSSELAVPPFPTPLDHEAGTGNSSSIPLETQSFLEAR
ncbi:G-type lectin S-receptor-like serine/threonine-protein kinase At5g24080 isoform X1 [Selaginella moellendorffii]|uniref:G-type lectin S-receptor-like serine/threonine-protein kinase At5g24080 isoform X1 n=1 Tax=Selaginella moellendorffii TaxID=88036 RepID=UPI000D1C39D4|nr:G-type lectin S-receptor-like serine/threonine-protein kinase At5g24080 isoform X1 [Selaginella moellendorffii]|eukprot:XP_024541617.1 G-type lectin S-receptor-like serine/threonine-protein kinase At5g24080 isoform X1 [Selaginella moellendorffii]